MPAVPGTMKMEIEPSPELREELANLRHSMEYYQAEYEKGRVERNAQALRRARRRQTWHAIGAALTPIGVWLLLGYVVMMNMCGCAHVPMVPPAHEGARRSAAEQTSAAIRLEVVCMAGDPLAGSLSAAMYYGSGVFVGPRDVLTAYHVVHCPVFGAVGLIQVVLPNGRRLGAEVMKTDARHDLARLVLSNAVYPGPVPGLARPHRADRICIAPGYPTASPRQCGLVTEVADDGSHWGEVHHLAPTFVGNSGSGVYDSDGYLIGIVDSRPQDTVCSIPDDMAREGFSCGGRVAMLWGRGMLP